MNTASTAHPLHRASPYQSYVYGYPHKTAYRPLKSVRSVADVWKDEDRSRLFLYFHVPFCEQRCGFCNLFTTVTRDDRPQRYLDTLRHHAEGVMQGLGDDAQFARLAIGGGTPTYFNESQLESMFDIITGVMGADVRAIPTSVEASPLTATQPCLSLLREKGVDRLSIGVQTFFEDESKRLGRTQKRADVHRALQAIRDAGFPILNIDLIYGGDGQTPESWLESMREALQYSPEQVYLYPLYVRPGTGLAKLQRQWDDERLALYRMGRDSLLDAGYQQVSMRMFQRQNSPANEGPVYCCQVDGMVGVGCGARSYTGRLHYSSEYAVARSGVLGILDDYMSREPDSFRMVDFGFELARAEQQRRFVMMSLLQAAGLDRAQYIERFGHDVLEDLPELHDLHAAEFAIIDEQTIRLNEKGLERSDAIGPWLWSDAVRQRMNDYQWR